MNPLTECTDVPVSPESNCLKAAARDAYAQQTRRTISDDEIVQYLPMVHKIVQRVVSYLCPSLSREDLVSAGTIGLMKAARDYDPSHEAEFQTYAYIRIRGAILDELKKSSFVPEAVNKQIREAAQVRTELTEQRGRAPSDEELAGKLGISTSKLNHIFSSARANQFLSFEGASEESSFLGCFENTGEPRPSQRMERIERIEHLTHAISELDQKQRQVIVLYYQQDLTMKQIGEVLELTESRVSQLHAKALFSLSTKLSEWKHDSE